MTYLCTLHAHEDELGELDSVAGDSDHGRGMCRGVDAALAEARTVVAVGATSLVLLLDALGPVFALHEEVTA